MLLGALSIGVALVIRRWLGRVPGEFVTALPPSAFQERTKPG